ncbi:MAG: DUF4342 domain-containing protein [Candidatus Bathyarchaeota archaeon]|nr:DUF4342 domain-containing protein [Candidatus Bathyarchaeota archaeon]
MIKNKAIILHGYTLDIDEENNYEKLLKLCREFPDDAYYCPYCGVSVKKIEREAYSISSVDLVKKIKELIREGNVTRIIVKTERGETLLDMPMTVGLIGTVLAPWMAALGVIAALVINCNIIVERKEPKSQD